MAESTAIQWADMTWSPWEGCTKVSPGCDHCYASSMNRWLRKGENWGPGAPRRIYSPDHWDKPLRWNRKAEKEGKSPRVFPSVCDPFDNEVAQVIRQQFFDLVVETRYLTWLMLTKRIGNVRSMVPPAWLERGGWPKNVHLGATVVNQPEANRDIPKLLAVPAQVRFLSVEPQLEPIDLQAACTVHCPNGDCFKHSSGDRVVIDSEADGILVECICSRLNGLHLVIVGGESGREARPFNVEWARSIVRQCQHAGVPAFVKQLGARPEFNGMQTPETRWPDGVTIGEDTGRGTFRVHLQDDKGGDWNEWPQDLRVRGLP